MAVRQGGSFTTIIGISFPVQCPRNHVMFQPAVFPGAYWCCYGTAEIYYNFCIYTSKIANLHWTRREMPYRAFPSFLSNASWLCSMYLGNSFLVHCPFQFRFLLSLFRKFETNSASNCLNRSHLNSSLCW